MRLAVAVARRLKLHRTTKIDPERRYLSMAFEDGSRLHVRQKRVIPDGGAESMAQKLHLVIEEVRNAQLRQSSSKDLAQARPELASQGSVSRDADQVPQPPTPWD